jgi:hypothetical protein
LCWIWIAETTDAPLEGMSATTTGLLADTETTMTDDPLVETTTEGGPMTAARGTFYHS